MQQTDTLINSTTNTAEDKNLQSLGKPCKDLFDGFAEVCAVLVWILCYRNSKLSVVLTDIIAEGIKVSVDQAGKVVL